MKNFYKNEYLFSEIYLREITQLEEDPAVKATLSALKEYREYADTSNLETWNESFVHEILKALRFGVRKGDENAALLYQLGSDSTVTLCYSLLPSEVLDSTTMGRNWAEKIIRNLRNNQLKWGILTNGDWWRIYHTEEPTPYENYLEIDLKGIMDGEDVQQYQIFNKFMRAENFFPDRDGNCQFDVFKKESQGRINYIEEELKNALKQKEEGGKGILSNICMGYVDYLRNEKNPDFSDDTLRSTIYGAAMLYMFRLLFLFYAKARGLLKEANHELFSNVLLAAQKAQEQGDAGEDEYSLWRNLRNLFSNIDLTYNGGLFNPAENEFVEEQRVSNIYLAPVIYYMTFYRDKAGSQKPISYRDMAVRHLGSLYEGLLEHKLFVSDEDTEVKVTEKEVKFVPASKGGKIAEGKYIPAGQVYFGNDKDIRKASGSFYTPEYIVDYIVQNTVGKKLQELKYAFFADNKETIASIETAINKSEKDAFIGFLTKNIDEFIQEKILNLSILDPAMGSGHFLVNATNQITNFLTEFCNHFDIITDKDTSTRFWRRRVVENCIFGVDINPLAVELAKLSLWILSMARDQPLSFLDHHLKCGNSLVGARLSDLGHYPRLRKMKGEKKSQLLLFDANTDFQSDVATVLSKSRQIESQESKELDDIGDKKRLLNEIRDLLKPYRMVCDFHTSLYFENDISEEEYNRVLSVFNCDFEWGGTFFFHWETEFPEVLLDSDGFDCVIGNPPYVSADSSLYDVAIEQTLDTKNLFCFFSEIGLRITKKGGFHSFIVPLSGFAMPQMYSYQQLFLMNSESLELSNFSWRPGRIFKDVNIPVTIFFLKKKISGEIKSVKTTHYIRWYKDEPGAPLKKLNFVEAKKYLDVSPGFIPKIGHEIEISILDKMLCNPRLGNFISKKKINPHNHLYYRSKGGLYFKIFTDFYAGSSNEIRFSCKDEKQNPVLLPVLNSNIFFWFYELFSSCRVVNYENICCFPFDIDGLSEKICVDLIQIGKILMADVRKNAKKQIRNYAGFGKKECFTIYMRKSKKILDEIDALLSQHYSFTDDELKHLTNYMLKYRGDEK